MKGCKKCKLKYEDTHKFCSKCGSKLAIIQKKVEKEIEHKESKNKGVVHRILKKAGVEIVQQSAPRVTNDHQEKSHEPAEIKHHHALNPFSAFSLYSGDWTKLIFGVVLALLFFLILPVILILGYLINIIRSTINGEEQLPKWKFLSQIKDGLMFLWVAIVHLIIPIIVLIFGTANNSMGIIVLSIGLFAIASFLLSIALSHYAHGFRPFNFKLTIKAIKMRYNWYLKVFFLLWIIQVASNLIVNGANFNPAILNYLLLLVGLVFDIYLAYVWAKAYGIIYRSLMEAKEK